MTTKSPLRINFSEEWDKLQNRQIGDEFHTVRWIDCLHLYEQFMDQDVIVIVQGVPRYMTILTKLEVKKIMDLTEKFVQADTYPGMTVSKFYDMMADWYASKKNWNGWESDMVIAYVMVSEVL